MRRIYDAPTSPILDPGVHQTLDGRWLKNSDEGPRKGVVVAAGKGDKRHGYLTAELKRTKLTYTPNGWYEEREGVFGEDRIPMDVRVGDTIIYPRFESSHVKIGEGFYTFVHEADVMAVIEP